MNAAEPNMPSEIEEIKAAAEQGDPRAQFRLGWDYYIGDGVARDKMEAVKWYSAAAGQGLRKAQEILDIIEANKMLESEKDLAGAEENEFQTSAFRSRKWKALAVFVVLCAFLGLLLCYIGDNLQWFRKAVDIESGDVQSDHDVVDEGVERITGDQTESTEGLWTETQPTSEELPKDPNRASTKTGENADEIKPADEKPPIEQAKSEDDTGKGIMERLAIFAEKWLEGDSEPNEPREQ